MPPLNIDIWEHVQPHLVQTGQYSGNAKGVINGIGVVTCVYVNPDLDRFWVIDYRIYV